MSRRIKVMLREIIRGWCGIALLALLFLLSACGNTEEREALFAAVSNTGVAAVGTAETASSEEGITANADGIAATIASVMTVEPTERVDAVLSPTPLEQAVDEPALDQRAAALDDYLENLSETGQFMGTVLVASGGVVLLNEGYGLADVADGRANSPDTQQRIGSLTKQFTAAAILLLQERGLLNVNDAVSNYLPDYPGGEQISIHQLLTHTAGVPNYTRRPDLAQVVQTPIALDDLLAEFSNQPLDFSPGQQFSYSDSSYVVLTKIIEAVAGQTYADFIQSQLLDVVGMSRSGYDYLHDELDEPAVGYQMSPAGAQPAVDTESSWASGAGALYSTTGDLYKWDRALAAGSLLQASSLDAMFSPWVDMGQGYAYGYGWEIGQMAGRPSQTHAGNIFGFGSFIARFPEDDAVIIVLGNGLQMSPRSIAEELSHLLFAAS
ncbi:MAG: serine hydrolase domain-containing protein [Candidatus Promineifilaceae bacterium]